MEHFEDVLIQYRDYWHLIQIKTRDPELGPWKLSDAIGESGGIKSLYRTFEALRTQPIKLSLHLEGAIKRGDLLSNLENSSYNPREEKLVERVATALGIDADTCKQFL
jgi:hypothetical protein